MVENDTRDGGFEQRDGQESRLIHTEPGGELVPVTAWQAYNLDTLLMFLDA